MIYIAYTKTPYSADQSRLVRELLRRLCVEKYGMTRLPDILKTDIGKPYFADSKVVFSISHSAVENKNALWLAAAVSDTAASVGADIQAGTPKLERARRKILTAEEQTENADTHAAFTIKEAYGKMTGEGLTFGMNKLSAENIRRQYGVYEKTLDGAYVAAVYPRNEKTAEVYIEEFNGEN